MRDEPAAQRIRVRPVADYVEMWLLTAPTDTATELRLLDAALTIFDRDPDALMLPSVLNPCLFENGDALSALPRDAIEIPLRAE